MFDNNAFADEVFDEFMLNRAAQGAQFADFVALINMKAADNVDSPEKMSLLTEILNDLKLFIQPAENDMPH